MALGLSLEEGGQQVIRHEEEDDRAVVPREGWMGGGLPAGERAGQVE